MSILTTPAPRVNGTPHVIVCDPPADDPAAPDHARPHPDYEDLLDRRAYHELRDAAERSPELAELTGLVDQLEAVGEKLADFIHEHSCQCGCDLCSYMDDEDVSVGCGSWRHDLITASHTAGVFSSFAKGWLPWVAGEPRRKGKARG